ncbi:MAG: M14 family metallocarboxypeptidase [Oscillospiraceae bacterium]|nr:M14 family metallocarboxypeptidase [Oscillospiraceae bacterium]
MREVFRSEVLARTVDDLERRYPNIRRKSIGQSVLGKDIPVLIFGAGSHAVSYNAAHHGNEWITSPILLQFLEQYAEALSKGGQIAGSEAKHLYETSTLHLIPMVNPDGVDIAIDNRDDWKANAAGVDLNLQYPAGWERAREIKFAQGFTQPGPRDYVGTAPLSEPESRAMYDYTLQNDFALTLSYHSQGEVIYWQYLDHLPPRSKEIGQTFAALSGYALEETPYESGHAGYKDWFIKHFDRPGYTIEVGRGQNPLPLSQFDKIYVDNLGLLTAALTINAP